jgi:hypothetical protein
MRRFAAPRTRVRRLDRRAQENARPSIEVRASSMEPAGVEPVAVLQAQAPYRIQESTSIRPGRERCLYMAGAASPITTSGGGSCAASRYSNSTSEPISGKAK